ncbi:GNAT family N-acetyltransferase, partial [Arthrospira platensis SPKY2]
LFVSPKHRRSGVASGLLAAAAEFGRAVGAQSLSLSTAVTNTTAQSVYESAGWRRDNEFLVYELVL